MPNRLRNKTALITGASSGLGRAIAHAYAAEGAAVCCVDLYPNTRNPKNADTGKSDSIHNRLSEITPTHESLVALHGGEHIFVHADITEAADVEAAVAACVAQFGRLDIVVNNAGISVESQHPRVLRVHETSEEDWDKTMAVNARGMFLGCKFAIQQMLRQELVEAWGGDRGWIVNVASVQAYTGYYGTPSYAASKGAAAMLTKQVAIDYGPDRIHCNAVCPGFLKTSMTQNIQSNPDELRKINDAHPLGGMGDPEDVARVAVFLASEDARWVTGVPMPVDGGFLCL